MICVSSKTQGLLLQSIPYLGKKKILKVFTREYGLLSFFSIKEEITPFLLAEWVFQKSQKELLPLKEITIIQPFSHLKESYKVLRSAGLMAKRILETQAPDKSAEKLFDLTLFYFKNLSLSPAQIVASFHIKLLLYEGLFSEEKDPLFSEEEWDLVCLLGFSKSLSAIQNISAIPYDKIQSLFEKRLL